MLIFENKHDTEQWARGFARTLERPALVLMSGDLGAGKTQITRWCLDELGVREASSPTFAIHHHYAEAAVDHVDLYRIETLGELDDTGFWEIFDQSSALVFVEWADRVPRAAWPKRWTQIFVDVRVEPDGARAIKVSVVSERGSGT